MTQPVIQQQTVGSQDLNKILNTPSFEQPLGTDQYGRSMYVRLAAGLRLSFWLAGLSVVTSCIIGTGLAIFAAWCRGRTETLLDALINSLMALPGLILVLLFAAVIPGSFVMIYLAISIVLSLEYYRVIKASSKAILNSPAVESSQLLGFNHVYILKRHLLPELKPSLFTLSAYGAANAILMMASIGFVYVGLKPPTAELGLMIVELFPYYEEAPWLLCQPLVVLFTVVLSLNLLAGKNNHAIENR
ncbi:ABC transporter permease [Gayadomonas joobiniege]|uniref:ABC transporter permease n=1 Tax=Gayadomonas joobiniege TaxID=1234606 RepID=UPI001ED98D1E|nr:ABC transporter permease [Gayadomonas joobiniege]